MQASHACWAGPFPPCLQGLCCFLVQSVVRHVPDGSIDESNLLPCCSIVPLSGNAVQVANVQMPDGRVATGVFVSLGNAEANPFSLLRQGVAPRCTRRPAAQACFAPGFLSHPLSAVCLPVEALLHTQWK